ncbi:hypothetical protein NUSPORA_00642 [Nucleospora cyclopteri]
MFIKISMFLKMTPEYVNIYLVYQMILINFLLNFCLKHISNKLKEFLKYIVQTKVKQLTSK